LISQTDNTLVNKTNVVHNFSQYVYFFPPHVSGDYVPIIRRNNSIYATLGIGHSVWMIVCIPDSHPHGVTNTKRRIDTVISADDGHTVGRKIYRKEINILRKFVHQVGFIYKIIQGWTVNKT
jgi:hypothetical protein